MKKILGVVYLAAFCLTLAVTAGAQTQITSGAIQGTVTDPSGAVVPGADIEVKNLDTNFTRKLTTDTGGRFVALLLPPGRYTVTVKKEGFAELVNENVNLNVGQTINLSLGMKVAGAEARVVVTDTPTVETVRVEQSTTLNEITIGTTPILGRKFEDLLTLTPGVSIVQGPDGDEITFVGQRGIFTNISLDGGDYINGFFGEQVGGQRAPVDISVEAIKEFQVIVTGGSAEFGRTASGVVNVVTKSGTNDFHGSFFHYQRLEALTSDDSQGRPLKDFHREQTGGTLGGPIVKDKVFWFAAFEQIGGNLERPGLSQQLGSVACPVTTPLITNAADRPLIASNVDCSRVALINFIGTHPVTSGQQEGNPIRRPLHNSALFGRFDWLVTPRNNLNISYNFNRSIKINETFDVDTYGNSANGTEGSSRIQVVNVNLNSTITPRILNEGHFTYSRERRPRAANASNIPADTALGITDPTFAPNGPFTASFRFGQPFFLQPGVDELFYRTQIRDNISVVAGRHTFKLGGEWIHSLNDQVFRGFFEGRYIFTSVEGFMRYASPSSLGPGFGPTTVGCADGTFTDVNLLITPNPFDSSTYMCPNGSAFVNGPLNLYLQAAAGDGSPATDAAGASTIDNEEYAIFAQDKWQIRSNFTLSYGLRWEAQIFPNPTVPPLQTAYGAFLGDSRLPTDGTLHSQKRMFQPRVGFSWDPWNNGKSALRASWGIFNARQNMLSQVGSITANGVQQQTVFRDTALIVLLMRGVGLPAAAAAPGWPGLLPPPGAGSCTAPFTGVFMGMQVTNQMVTNPFPCFSGVRVFKDDYHNPRIYVTNVAYEFEVARDTSLYADFTHSKGVYLTRFIDLKGPLSFEPFLGGATLSTVTNSRGKSLYRGFTVGLRKRFSNRFQLESNYVFSTDRDDDSNERDPFTDRNCDINNLALDYAFSDRDIRHKFNFFAFFELPWNFQANTRMQARSAQPQFGIVSAPNCGTRNNDRKDNEYFSFDWRLQRPIKFGERFEVIPTIEMFNTFNNKNNVNPLSAPILRNFDGFVRQGVGDPLQVQLSFKIRW
jgi:hypothetical protein